MGWFKKKDPAGHVESILRRVVAYQKAGQLEKAKDAMQQALDLAPEDPKVWCFEADIRAASGDPGSAMWSLNYAISRDASFAPAWLGKGELLSALDRPEEALDCLTEAVRLDPSNSYAWDNRGVVLSKMGNLEEALASFDQAIAADRENALAYAHKAEVLEKQGIRRVN